MHLIFLSQSILSQFNFKKLDLTVFKSSDARIYKLMLLTDGKIAGDRFFFPNGNSAIIFKLIAIVFLICAFPRAAGHLRSF